MMDAERRLGWLSRVHLAVAVVGGLLFEGLYLIGLLRGENNVLFTALYGFNLAVIAAAVVLLLSAYALYGNKLLFLAALASLSWLLGSTFWVSYVFVLDEVLSYPSVAQFAFHGFHLLMIPSLLYVMRERGVGLWTPSVVGIVGASLFPIVIYFTVGTDLAAVVYNVFYFTLISSVVVLAAHLVVAKVLPLLGVSLLFFSVADINFVSTTLVEQAPLVFSLDPIWFTGHALVAYSFVRYSQRNELP